MEPVIRAGSTVEAREVEPGTYTGRRGDIVVFRAPASWPKEGGTVLVKRVIATGGDTVACCDPAGRVTINGAPLDEPYLGANAPLAGLGARCGGRRFDSVSVPEGQLFVMGDNRLLSVDSACHGPIPAASVVGIVAS